MSLTIKEKMMFISGFGNEPEVYSYLKSRNAIWANDYAKRVGERRYLIEHKSPFNENGRARLDAQGFDVVDEWDGLDPEYGFVGYRGMRIFYALIEDRLEYGKAELK